MADSSVLIACGRLGGVGRPASFEQHRVGHRDEIHCLDLKGIRDGAELAMRIVLGLLIDNRLELNE